jgi:hypothetical protein
MTVPTYADLHGVRSWYDEHDSGTFSHVGGAVRHARSNGRLIDPTPHLSAA